MNIPAVSNVHWYDEMKDQLDSLATATGRSKSWLAFEALRQYVAQESWQIGEIRKALAEADAGDFATDKEVAAVMQRVRNGKARHRAR